MFRDVSLQKFKFPAHANADERASLKIAVKSHDGARIGKRNKTRRRDATTCQVHGLFILELFDDNSRVRATVWFTSY